MDLKQILARNLRALMAAHPHLGSTRKLAPHCFVGARRVGARTIARLLEPASTVQPQLDTIAAIARAFRLPAWLLLTPDFDPRASAKRTPPSEEVLALAHRILEHKETLQKIFPSEAAPAETVPPLLTSLAQTAQDVARPRYAKRPCHKARDKTRR